MEKEMKKEIEKKDIVRALENLFVSGYDHVKMYKDGGVAMFLDANGDVIGAADLLFHLSLPELLEGFVEDTPMSPEDVQSLMTKNPNGVRFGDYLHTVADELYENLDVD